MESEYEINVADVAQVRVVMHDDEMPEYPEHLTATLHSRVYGLTNGEPDVHRYWLISGDNTGSQQLVVHPYMIEPLRALLLELSALTDVGAA